jgi:lipopolysaccharide transport system permease protein
VRRGGISARRLRRAGTRLSKASAESLSAPGAGATERTLHSARASGGSAAAAWVENRPSTGWLPRLDLRELWAYRELALFLALRDLKLRYKQTAFGVAWAIIQPLGAAAIFTIVFGRLAGLPSDGLPYAVFVFAGMIAWSYVSSAVGAAAESLVEHRGLVTNVYFPRLLAPLAAVVPGVLDLVISLVILAAFMAAYGVAPSAALLLLPFWLVALVGTALAAGLWLSALNVLYRDVRYALGFLIQLWLFTSPIVFPSSLVDGDWNYVYSANPLVGALDGFRWSLLGAPAPGTEDLVSLGVGLLLFAGGIVYFRRVERRLGDRI